MSNTVDLSDAVIASIIREHQGAADMSTTRLSILTGIEKSTMLRIHRGTRPVPFGELKKIARALGTTALSIVDEAEARLDQLP